MIHDLGKTSIEHEVLGRTGPLNQTESTDVREHSQIGHDQLKGLVHRAISESVLCHHENWDGSGYPLGLRGNEIPLMARIIFVADSYDVMTVGRSYRPALSIVQAGERLSAAAGNQFDPEVVDAFASVDSRLLRPVYSARPIEHNPGNHLAGPPRPPKKRTHRPVN